MGMCANLAGNGSLARRLGRVAALSAMAAAVGAGAQRLPETVVPQSYALTLTPDLKAAVFSGVESIEVTVKAPTTTITLNAIELQFQSVVIAQGEKSQKAEVTLDESRQQATFTVREPLRAGKATLAIRYSGILNNELRGFYLSKTEKRNYAVTQFESTDARRAYPSFDEPQLKATYDVSLVVDANDNAISNGPLLTDKPGPLPGKHTLHFAPTPRMSTYLVAFLVGDFQCTRGESDGVAIRACSTPDKVALTPYSLAVAQRVLHYYNHYFGIAYPLKKLDLIALPDFEAGAMENFGAITYRETDMLLDEKTASVGAKKEVALVVAHEMAHQWFGDLVTMRWWDNLWLNEGFATWMESKSIHDLYPEFQIDQMIADVFDRTLNLDAAPTTRAIRAKAETPDEINQMFDGIAYGKAGSVLQMVENYEGAETFRQGVHNYLAAHQYGNATAEDFWNAQTAASHKPIDKIMESLVAQPGEPLVSFGAIKDGQVAVSQQRFFLSPSQTVDPAQKWTLPVCFKTANGQDCQLLTPETKSLPVPAGTLFANAGGNGYYRSAYTEAAYKAILSGVDTRLTPAERISLIGDEWAQLRANKATAGDYLNLAAAVSNDANAGVLSAALSGIGTIHSRVAASPAERAGLEAWVRKTFGPAYAKLPKPAKDDSPALKELRATLLDLVGGLGKDAAVQAEAKTLATQYLANSASVESTLGQTALAVSASNGDAALFDQLQKVYETSANPEIQETALRLLAEFEDPALAQRSLEYAASGKVRNQDAAYQFAIPLSNAATRDLAWKFIQTNWDKVQAQLTTSSGAELVGSTGNLCSKESADEVKSFFAAHPVPSSDKSLRHALEHIDGCVELRTLQGPHFTEWLAAQPK